MANKTLFASLRGALIPQTDTVNSENAPAYALAPKQAMAQHAATGCFGRAFYATADGQLGRVLELCEAIASQGDPEFVARVAIYNQSWVDQGRGRGTALLAEWSEFRQRNPHARLVCLDVRVRAVPSRHGSSTGRASGSPLRVLFLQPLSPQF